MTPKIEPIPAEVRAEAARFNMRPKVQKMLLAYAELLEREPVAQRIPNSMGRHSYWDYGETHSGIPVPENLYTMDKGE